MADDPVLSFDPLRILRQLRDDGVEFVLIGGIAGRIHGSPTVTNDLDICYRRTKVNCERLAKTLQELGARLRDLPADLRAPVDTGTIWQGHNFTFIDTISRSSLMPVSSTVSHHRKKAHQRPTKTLRTMLRPS